MGRGHFSLGLAMERLGDRSPSSTERVERGRALSAHCVVPALGPWPPGGEFWAASVEIHLWIMRG